MTLSTKWIDKANEAPIEYELIRIKKDDLFKCKLWISDLILHPHLQENGYNLQESKMDWTRLRLVSDLPLYKNETLN